MGLVVSSRSLTQEHNRDRAVGRDGATWLLLARRQDDIYTKGQYGCWLLPRALKKAGMDESQTVVQAGGELHVQPHATHTNKQAVTQNTSFVMFTPDK